MKAVTTWLVRSLHSPGAVLLNISHEQRIIQLGLSTISEQSCTGGTNLNLQIFWCLWPKLWQVQICSPDKDYWHVGRKISCVMCYKEETQLYYALFVGNVKQDSPWWVQRAHKSQHSLLCAIRRKLRAGQPPLSKDSTHVTWWVCCCACCCACCSVRCSADSTQVTWRVLESHKLLCLVKGNTDFGFKSCICYSYNDTSTNLCPYSESPFARGRPDVSGTLGPLWVIYIYMKFCRYMYISFIYEVL